MAGSAIILYLFWRVCKILAESFGKHPWERQDPWPFPAAPPMRTHLTYVFRSKPVSISSEISKRCSVVCITPCLPTQKRLQATVICPAFPGSLNTVAACMGPADILLRWGRERKGESGKRAHMFAKGEFPLCAALV